MPFLTKEKAPPKFILIFFTLVILVSVVSFGFLKDKFIKKISTKIIKPKENIVIKIQIVFYITLNQLLVLLVQLMNTIVFL